MTVPAEAEELQIEHGVAELSLVVFGGLLLSELALDAVDDTRIALEPVEQRALRERVVREVVVGGDAAFVAPPDLRLAPVGLALRRFLVCELGGGAARKCDVPACACCLRQSIGNGGGNVARVLEDVELDVAGHESPAASSFERSIAACMAFRNAARTPACSSSRMA